MSHVTHTTIGPGRRVVIPAAICQEVGLRPGSPVVIEATGAGVVLRLLDDVVREVRAFFADAAPADTLMSDELIRERRAEAEQEARD